MTKNEPRQLDPYLRAVGEIPAERCDCPCHFWPAVTERGRCCESAGLRYFPDSDTYGCWEGR
jgi:hypothetical protein